MVVQNTFWPQSIKLHFFFAKYFTWKIPSEANFSMACCFLPTCQNSYYISHARSYASKPISYFHHRNITACRMGASCLSAIGIDTCTLKCSPVLWRSNADGVSQPGACQLCGRRGLGFEIQRLLLVVFNQIHHRHEAVLLVEVELCGDGVPVQA